MLITRMVINTRRICIFLFSPHMAKGLPNFQKMKIIFFICAIFMMYSTNAQNQSTVDSVKIEVKQLFEAMRNNDSALLVNSFADSAILQTITPKSDGAVVVKTESISRFGSSVKHAEKGSWDEQAEINAVHIDGPLASVWAPYR